MITQKIFEIMQEVGYIRKEGKIEMGNKGSYTGLTERQVLRDFRPRFLEKSLIILPYKIHSIEKTGSVTTVNMDYVIHDVQDNEQMIIPSIGQGSSTGDKGAGMAFTYSLKYLIVKMLMLEQGDDPDQTGDVKHEEEHKEMFSEIKILEEEIRNLQKGGLVNDEIAQSMVLYINKNKTDKAILREARSSIDKLKNNANK